MYATEQDLGRLRRFSPDGKTASLVFESDVFSQLSNVKWGAGYGGFSPEKMYVAAAANYALLEVDLGVPGVALPFPLLPQK